MMGWMERGGAGRMASSHISSSPSMLLFACCSSCYVRVGGTAAPTRWLSTVRPFSL
jgi:hypothetical protein